VPEVIIVPALFSTIAFVVWVLVNGSQRRHHLKLVTDFNTRLIERIGSMKDFSEFLETSGGARFVDSLVVERSPTRPQDSILRAVQVGIVLLTLGVGLLVTSEVVGFIDDEPLIIVGAIAMSLGTGFLLSAIASYRLARSLGVLDRTERLPERPERH
jgi:hypothetical protein